MDSEKNTENGDSTGSNGDNRTFRLQVEATLAQRFVKAMEIRMKQLEVTNAQDFVLSAHERKVLMNVVTANMLEGAAAGVITFFILRRMHGEYFKYLKRSYAERSVAPIRRPTMPNSFNSPYQQIPTKPQQVTNITNVMGNATESTSSDSGSGAGGTFGLARWMVNATSLLFDGIISLYVALFVSTRNPDKFIQEISDLPLMEGESIVSKELCPILLNELKSMHQDLAQDNDSMNSPTLPKISAKNKVYVRDALKDPQTPMLQCFMNFCTNCRRRAAYEQLLREQSGLSNDTVVPIPPPGVPPALDVTNDIIDMASLSSDIASLSSEIVSEDIYNDSNFDDGTTNSNDWTEPFVTDQDEKRRK
jgi:hypothetical protein